MKPRKAVLARFKRTGTGKLMRYRQGKRHLLTGKSSKRKRRLGKAIPVDKTQHRTYARLMGAE